MILRLIGMPQDHGADPGPEELMRILTIGVSQNFVTSPA